MFLLHILQFDDDIVECIQPTLIDNILTEFSTLFEKPTGLPPPCTSDHCMTIQPSQGLVTVKPYRYLHFQKEEISRMVAQMLDDGVIRPSTSPFSTPVLLVRENDGMWRFCVDYHALNNVTVRDAFPIPTIDEIFYELHGLTFFTKLDLRSGFHQILMSEDSIAGTAFRTSDDHFEFNVMPFGLSNAPLTF